MTHLKQVFYLSRAVSNMSEAQVRQIQNISQRNNRKKDITGCLLFTGAHFAQVLEGESSAVDQLVERISRDIRHANVLVVIDRSISIRRYPGWSMGFLVRLDMTDRVESLLSGRAIPQEQVIQLFDAAEPDSVLGTL